MNVLGDSANHLFTFFSASTRSDHADLPIVSDGASTGGEDDEELRRKVNVERENLDRTSGDGTSAGDQSIVWAYIV
jgi:hypothetical protein